MVELVASWRAGITHAYRAVFTQANAGGGNVIIDVSPGAGSEFIIDSILTGLDNYAADRTVNFDILDTGNNRISRLLSLATVDNEYLLWPSLATTTLTTYMATRNYMVSGTDKLSISATALANTETLTINLRLRVKGRKASIVSTRSTGTVGAPTVTYDVVL